MLFSSWLSIFYSLSGLAVFGRIKPSGNALLCSFPASYWFFLASSIAFRGSYFYLFFRFSLLLTFLLYFGYSLSDSSSSDYCPFLTYTFFPLFTDYVGYYIEAPPSYKAFSSISSKLYFGGAGISSLLPIVSSYVLVLYFIAFVGVYSFFFISFLLRGTSIGSMASS